MAQSESVGPRPIALHGNSRLRHWLGENLAGDPEKGDLVWRRMVHLSGALVLLYFVIPGDFFVTPWPQTTTVLLLLLLEAGLFIEFFRHLGWVEVPMIREYERDRIAGYCWYAMGLAFAVLVFPEAIAIGVVLGAALVDPLLGELRRRGLPRSYLSFAFVAYVGLVAASLTLVGGWSTAPVVVGALAAGSIALAIEPIRLPFVDDDFTLPVVPGLFLWALMLLWPGGVSA